MLKPLVTVLSALLFLSGCGSGSEPAHIEAAEISAAAADEIKIKKTKDQWVVIKLSAIASLDVALTAPDGEQPLPGSEIVSRSFASDEAQKRIRPLGMNAPKAGGYYACMGAGEMTLHFDPAQASGIGSRRFVLLAGCVVQDGEYTDVTYKASTRFDRAWLDE
jgi:hypothetical protein